MDWWIWLGVISAIVGITSAIDRWFRPLFRPLFSNLFKRHVDSIPRSLKIKDLSTSYDNNVGHQIPISFNIPAYSIGIKRMEISLTVDYVDGLPDAEPNIKLIFDQARVLKNNREYERAISLFIECSWLTQYAEQKIALYIQIGKCYIYILRYDEALAYYNIAKDLALKTGNKEGLKSSQIDLGVIYKRQDQLNKAINCLENAIELCHETHNKRSESRAMIDLASVYEEQGKLGKALKLFKSAFKIAKSIKDEDAQGYALYGIGAYYYRNNKEIKRPLKFYEEALKIFNKYQNKEWMAKILWSKGLLNFIKIPTEYPSACWRDESGSSERVGEGICSRG